VSIPASTSPDSDLAGAEFELVTFAPGTSDESWLRAELSRLQALFPDSLRILHLGFALDYHLSADPADGFHLTLATSHGSLLGAAVWAVGPDAIGQECLMIGEIGTTGQVKGVGRALLLELAAQALALNVEVSCLADVAARGFYERLGFIQDPPRDVRYVWPRANMQSALAAPPLAPDL
jgi:GNAT superfamily N-acetyltransferase